MYYSLIRQMDISNGPGIRVSLFVSGCSRKCFNCFNPETHSFTNGQLYTRETYNKIISLLNKPYIRGLSLLGGDPLEQVPDDINECLIPLINKAHEMGKDVWLWTGYTFEEVFNRKSIRGKCFTIKEALEEIKWDSRKLLISKCDILIDGPYIDSQRNIALPYCGSENQRVIDIKKTIENYEDKEEIIYYV